MREAIKAQSVEQLGQRLSGLVGEFTWGPGHPGQSSFFWEEVKVGQFKIVIMSGGNYEVRRDWSHIRRAAMNSYTVRMPIKGSVWCRHGTMQDPFILKPQQFIIQCNDRPFRTGGMEDNCKTLSVRVPKHLMISAAPNVDNVCGKPMRADFGAALLAKDIFYNLFGAAGEMKEPLAGKFAELALEALADAVDFELCEATPMVDEAAAHLTRLFAYLDTHFSLPGLTASMVANACGISRRYLHYLMKSKDTTFAQELWSRRIEQAHHWLCDPAFSGRSFAELAELSGFSGPSHFSYMYKRKFGISPSDARANNLSIRRCGKTE